MWGFALACAAAMLPAQATGDDLLAAGDSGQTASITVEDRGWRSSR